MHAHSHTVTSPRLGCVGEGTLLLQRNFSTKIKQVAQLSQRDRTVGVLALAII